MVSWTEKWPERPQMLHVWGRKIVEMALKEDFLFFRESPKHGEAGIPSVQLHSMNWVTFNGSLSSDYLKSTVNMLLKSWASQQDHLTVFFSVTESTLAPLKER